MKRGIFAKSSHFIGGHLGSKVGTDELEFGRELVGSEGLDQKETVSQSGSFQS